jgi:hypothetical protein
MMAMKAGKVDKETGEWDDLTSLGALLENKFEPIKFKPFEEGADVSEDDQKYNKRKSFEAIAAAVIEYIKSNMEIKGIKATGKVTINVKGETEAAVTDGHVHEINLSLEDIEIALNQSNDGTGHVQ